MIDVFELFKEENFVLATLCTRYEKLGEFLEIKELEFDLFYKENNGYTRFSWEGNEFYVGDNSDGKGRIIDVVSAWRYYQKDDLSLILNQYNEVCVIKRLFDKVGEPILRKYIADLRKY